MPVLDDAGHPQFPIRVHLVLTGTAILLCTDSSDFPFFFPLRNIKESDAKLFGKSRGLASLQFAVKPALARGFHMML
jgi:hypothetical protein